MPLDGMAIFDNSSDKTSLNEKANDTDKQASVFAESYLFDDMRMEVRNERSQTQEQLNTKITSAETAAEKNEIFDEMALLVKRDSAEALMEMQIIALGYPDAFVRTDAGTGTVNVTVLSEDGHSKKQSSEIINLVMTTWEDTREVSLEFKGGS